MGKIYNTEDAQVTKNVDITDGLLISIVNGEKEKPILYSDLMSMIDDAMEDDFIKLKAALEIVLSFNKIEKWRKKILNQYSK